MYRRKSFVSQQGWSARTRRSDTWWFCGRIFLSAGTLALVLYLVDVGEVFRKIVDSDLVDLALALAILSLIPLLGAWRWRVACMATDSQSSYRIHLRIGLVASFYGQALPTMAGLEGIRIWLYSRVIGSLPAAASGVLADRIAGLLALLLLVVAGYPLQDQVIASALGRAVAATLSLLSLIGLTVFFALMLPLASRFGRRLPFELLRYMAAKLGRTLGFSLSMAKLIGISLTMQATTLLALWLIARGLGATVTPLELLVLVPPAFLALLIPFSISGWGLREGAFVVFLGLAGIPSDASLAVSLLLGIALTLISLPGALLTVTDDAGPPQKEIAQS